jgi:endonuclease IV
MYACTHGKLLYNIAGSADPQDLEKMWWKTKLGLTSELDITAGFGDGVVVHMGSCKDKKAGLSNITKTLEYVLTHETDQTKELIKELQDPDLVKKRMVILENSAGEGTKFGSTLEEIGQIISSVKPELQDQIRVCIDTAHIYGAGQYDFGVVDVGDPLKRGRVRVRVFGKFDQLDIGDIPWAAPGMASTAGSSSGGGFLSVPKKGSLGF